MAEEHRLIEDIVRNRTREGIRPYISHFGLVGRAGLAGLGMEYAPSFIQSMVRTDHLVQYPPDVDPTKRDVDCQEVYLTLPDVDRLQRWVHAEVESEGETDTDLVGHLNTEISRLRERQVEDETESDTESEGAASA